MERRQIMGSDVWTLLQAFAEHSQVVRACVVKAGCMAAAALFVRKWHAPLLLIYLSCAHSGNGKGYISPELWKKGAEMFWSHSVCCASHPQSHLCIVFTTVPIFY